MHENPKNRSLTRSFRNTKNDRHSTYISNTIDRSIKFPKAYLVKIIDYQQKFDFFENIAKNLKLML